MQTFVDFNIVCGKHADDIAGKGHRRLSADLMTNV